MPPKKRARAGDGGAQQPRRPAGQQRQRGQAARRRAPPQKWFGYTARQIDIGVATALKDATAALEKEQKALAKAAARRDKLLLSEVTGVVKRLIGRVE